MAEFFDEEAEMSADGSHSDDEMSDEVETAEDRAMIDDEHQGDDDSDVDNAVQADAAMMAGEAEKDMQTQYLKTTNCLSYLKALLL